MWVDDQLGIQCNVPPKDKGEHRFCVFSCRVVVCLGGNLVSVSFWNFFLLCNVIIHPFFTWGVCFLGWWCLFSLFISTFVLKFHIFCLFSVVWFSQVIFDQETDQITESSDFIFLRCSASFCSLQCWLHIATWLCQSENKGRRQGMTKNKIRKKQRNCQKKTVSWSSSSGRGLPHDPFSYFLVVFMINLLVLFLLLSVTVIFLGFPSLSEFWVVSSFLTWLYWLNTTWLSEIENNEDRSTETGPKMQGQTKKDFGKMFVVLGRVSLGYDLQVVIVWCVFLFVFFGGGSSCLSLSSLLQKHNPPPKKKNGKTNNFIMVCGCVVWFFAGVSLATPKEAPDPKKQNKENKNKKGKG